MTISVTQLNNYIKGMMDIDPVLNDLSVCGEVTNVKKSHNGWYFSLKDDGAAINCFCYGNAAVPVTGLVTVAEGQLNFFARSGAVSLFVRRLTSSQNTGDAYKRFVELRDKLAKEGLFDEARKKPVPHCAKKIGVVTSETGAVIHDIENVALRRQPFSEILLYPVRVQGEGAEEEIACGIRYFGKSDVDVVIVGRGGGSNEDLSVFNAEAVVRAIAECPKPVVSAVGHGVDFTLSDFAADRRAVTPSEAAELVTLDSAKEKLRILANLDKISMAAAVKLSTRYRQVQNDCRLICTGVGRRLDRLQTGTIATLVAVQHAAEAKLSATSAALDKAVGRLDNINPLSVLKRGFGYVSADGRTVRSVNDVNIGDNIDVQLSDGKLTATVVGKEEK